MNYGDEFMRIGLGSDDDPMKADMRELIRLWIAGMTPEHRARMDERIVSQFDIDMPRDTALILLRDLINGHAMDTKQGIEIKDGHPQRATLVTNFNAESVTWDESINAIVHDKAYRLCNYCGKPFSFKSTKAKFCSDLCRNYSSRANKKQA